MRSQDQFMEKSEAYSSRRTDGCLVMDELAGLQEDDFL